jgi:hypothetical protein
MNQSSKDIELELKKGIFTQMTESQDEGNTNSSAGMYPSIL